MDNKVGEPQHSNGLIKGHFYFSISQETHFVTVILVLACPSTPWRLDIIFTNGLIIQLVHNEVLRTIWEILEHFMIQKLTKIGPRILKFC